jgi:hypothetical protein
MAKIDRYLRDSLAEHIVLENAGKPSAIVGEFDYDDMDFANSHEFWAMIQQRRRERTIPWKIAEQRLNALDH